MKSEGLGTRDEGVPTAVRMCPVCDELAWGEACESCAEIERESTALATSLVNIGVPEVLWMGQPKDRAQSVLRLRTEEKFKALREERLNPVLDHPTTCRVIGCANKALYGDFCGRCREELEADGGESASRLSKVCHATGAVLVLWYLLWQFRGYIFDCFNLWFGGK
jgi:hypothetical protein